MFSIWLFLFRRNFDTLSVFTVVAPDSKLQFSLLYVTLLFFFFQIVLNLVPFALRIWNCNCSAELWIKCAISVIFKLKYWARTLLVKIRRRKKNVFPFEFRTFSFSLTRAFFLLPCKCIVFTSTHTFEIFN